MAAAGDMGLTPAMRQYWDVKNKYPDCVVLFRMGDFYETFYDDAKTVSQDLNIVLTSRGKDEKKAPLAGIPYHAIDNYLKKLVDKGHKVVIVEQLEDPKLAKGIVKRGVVRIVTPGTVIEPHMVDERANNYIVGVYSSGSSAGLCACDVSTGEMRTTEVGFEGAEAEFEKFRPAEVLLPKDGKGYGWVYMLARERGFKVTELEHYKFDEENGRHVLRKIAGVESFSSYGLEERQLAKRALSGVLAYLDYTLLGHMAVPQLGRIAYYSTSGSMSIDCSTMRNLEIMHSLADGSERGTLQEIINNAATPMGSRAIRKWVSAPLLSLEGINGRLDNVSAVVGRPIEVSRLRDALKSVGDIERIATRTAYGTVAPRELLMLRQSLELVEEIKGLLKNGGVLEGFYGKFAGMELSLIHISEPTRPY